MCVCMKDVARIPASAISTGAIPGVSRVALRAVYRMSVWKETRREIRTVLVPCRASPAIVQMKTKRMSNSKQRAARGQHMVQVVCTW